MDTLSCWRSVEVSVYYYSSAGAVLFGTRPANQVRQLLLQEIDSPDPTSEGRVGQGGRHITYFDLNFVILSGIVFKDALVEIIQILKTILRHII